MLEYHLDIWYQPHTISYLLKGTQIIVLDNEHGASKTQHNSCHRVDLLIAKHIELPRSMFQVPQSNKVTAH